MKDTVFRRDVKVGSAVVNVYKAPNASNPECCTLVHYEGRRRVRQTCVGVDKVLANAKETATRINSGQWHVNGLDAADYADLVAESVGEGHRLIDDSELRSGNGEQFD